jgi:hypothetical protein
MDSILDIWKEKNAVDLKKHRNLWNDVIYGTPMASLAAASKLYDLGEMSKKTFQVLVLAAGIESTDKKGGKWK